LTLAGNGNSTFGGTISGAGALAKSGTGTLTLTGTNTFSGGTTISAGTLNIGSGGTTGLLAGNVLDNAALVFNRSDSSFVLGNISGSARGTKQGTGPLAIVGDLTHTGGTTVTAGTLMIGNGTTTGTITGNITNNSALAFNRSDASAYAGVASGDWLAQQTRIRHPRADRGQHLLPAAPTVHRRHLQIGAGGTTGSITGNVTNNATLAFNRSNAASFTGVVSGTGGLLEQGAGNLTLSAQNTYAGATTVSGGTLTVGVVNALPITTPDRARFRHRARCGEQQTVAGFFSDGSGSSLVLGFGATFTVAMPVANTSTTFAGSVSGGGVFAVSGAGGDVVNLTGSVTNTGGTSLAPAPRSSSAPAAPSAGRSQPPRAASPRSTIPAPRTSTTSSPARAAFGDHWGHHPLRQQHLLRPHHHQRRHPPPHRQQHRRRHHHRR